MNPSGLMIRSGKMRIILVMGFMMASFLLLFLTHQTLKLRGIEKENHICIHQKDSLVAQLQVCVEYGKRMDSTLSQEKSLKNECHDRALNELSTLAKTHKEELDKQEAVYKKLIEEFELYKKERKTNEEELTKQLEFFSQTKQEVKTLQDQVQTLIKEKETLQQNFMDQNWTLQKNEDELKQCTKTLKQYVPVAPVQAEANNVPVNEQITSSSTVLSNDKTILEPVATEEAKIPPMVPTPAAVAMNKTVEATTKVTEVLTEVKPSNATLTNSSAPTILEPSTSQNIKEQNEVSIASPTSNLTAAADTPSKAPLIANSQNLPSPEVPIVEPNMDQEMDPNPQDGNNYAETGDDSVNGEDLKLRHQDEIQGEPA